MKKSKSKLIFAAVLTGFVLLFSLAGSANEQNAPEDATSSTVTVGEEEELPTEDQNSTTILNQETSDLSEDEDTSIEE